MALRVVLTRFAIGLSAALIAHTNRWHVNVVSPRVTVANAMNWCLRLLLKCTVLALGPTAVLTDAFAHVTTRYSGHRHSGHECSALSRSRLQQLQRISTRGGPLTFGRVVVSRDVGRSALVSTTRALRASLVLLT